jgi:hypothetical protein
VEIQPMEGFLQGSEGLRLGLRIESTHLGQNTAPITLCRAAL